jgi:hypothetical protein
MNPGRSRRWSPPGKLGGLGDGREARTGAHEGFGLFKHLDVFA